MKKLLKVLGILLLVIVLLAAAVCVWLYSANKKQDFTCDDVFRYANEEPMTDAERYTFSAAADTMTMTLNKSDIYWYILEEYGDNFFDELSDELDEADLRLDGVALTLHEDGVDLNAKLRYEDFFSLNVRIPCTLTYDDSAFILQPEGVTAFGIDFSGLIGLALSRYSLEFPYDHLMLDWIDSMEIGTDGIRLTGPMAVNYMGMAREGFTKEELETMLEDRRCSYAAEILYKYTEDPAEGKRYWMSLLEDDPSLFTTIFEQLFSMISPQTFGGFHVTELNNGMIFRLIPTYSPLDYQENYKLLAADYKQ